MLQDLKPIPFLPWRGRSIIKMAGDVTPQGRSRSLATAGDSQIHRQRAAAKVRAQPFHPHNSLLKSPLRFFCIYRGSKKMLQKRSATSQLSSPLCSVAPLLQNGDNITRRLSWPWAFLFLEIPRSSDQRLFLTRFRVPVEKERAKPVHHSGIMHSPR